MMESVQIVSSIIKSFRIELAFPENEVAEVADISLGPKKGLFLKLSKWWYNNTTIKLWNVLSFNLENGNEQTNSIVVVRCSNDRISFLFTTPFLFSSDFFFYILIILIIFVFLSFLFSFLQKKNP